MKSLFPMSLLGVALMASVSFSQDYWEYAPLEDETEHHSPLTSTEIEYEDDGDIEVESEAYEYEAGEGYHEEEWYDPSDWFDSDDHVDYETDDYGFGYNYDDDAYAYDDDYDYYDYDYDYAYNYDDAYDDDEDVDYEYNQQVTGRIEALQRFRGKEGAPRSVRLKLKTDDGKTRMLHLGDLAYVDRYLPKIKKGGEVVIAGEMVEKNGKEMFKAKEMRSEDNSYLIPEYQYDRRVEGKLKGLRVVRMKDSDVELVVARVKTKDGKMMDVRLGDRDTAKGITRSMRPGAKVRAEGYRREVDDKSTFVVQDFKVLKQSKKDGEKKDQRQARKESKNR